MARFGNGGGVASARLPVIRGDMDFDQFMALQCLIGFTQEIVGYPFLADPDERFEVVSPGFECVALLIVQWRCLLRMALLLAATLAETCCKDVTNCGEVVVLGWALGRRAAVWMWQNYFFSAFSLVSVGCMGTMREDPHRAVVLGAGRGGTSILEMLLDEDLVEVVGVVDVNPDAEGIALAKAHRIPVFSSVDEALHACAPCVAFNMTGNEMLEAVASEILGVGGVVGGLEASLIWRMVTNLKNAKKELRFQASHDPLTGLYNRRHILEQLHQGVSQSIRYRHDYTVVMIDLDHFKQVNDTYGHAAGDEVLKNMARVLKQEARESDIPGRWGGEEFIVLLPHTDLNGAKAAAEMWLEQLRASPLQLDSGETVAITFSAGVAALPEQCDGEEIDPIVEQLLHVADERMYAAKEQGRNRVSISTDISTESIAE